MKFSTAIALALTSIPLAFCALTPDEVVANIIIVTRVSGDTNSAVGVLSLSSPASQVQSASQVVPNNLNTIISNLAADVQAMSATPSFTDVDAGPVVDALREFVRVHQILLSTIIGKHSIFAQFAVTAPIAAALRNLETAIDSFSFSMIDLIPTRSADVQSDKDQLDTSVGNTITLYEQFCIPSILYPAVLPVCVSL